MYIICKEERSSETTLHHLVSRTEVQLAATSYALDVFLDIENVFDNSLNISTKKAMNRHDNPEAIWALKMLTGRSLTINHGDTILKDERVSSMKSFSSCIETVVDKLLVKPQKAGLLTYILTLTTWSF